MDGAGVTVVTDADPVQPSKPFMATSLSSLVSVGELEAAADGARLRRWIAETARAVAAHARPLPSPA